MTFGADESPLDLEARDQAVRVSQSRAKVAMVSVGALTAFHFVQAAFVAYETMLLQRLRDHDLSVAESIRSGGELMQKSGSIETLGWLVSGILFLRWVHAAHIAAGLLGRGVTMNRSSASSAVWAYFIPFVNLVRPYENMSTLSWSSDPSDLDLPMVREVHPTPGYREAAVRMVAPTPFAPPRVFIGAWWGAYILMSVGGVAVGFMKPSPNDLPGLVSMFEALVGYELWFVLTGVLCLTVVRGISACQVERLRRLEILEQTPA
jgi:hypothetical protein